MKKYFDEQGILILKKLLPNCSLEKNNDTLLVKQGDKTLEFKSDFGQLTKLIDDDRILRQQDSAEWYYLMLSRTIESELSRI